MATEHSRSLDADGSKELECDCARILAIHASPGPPGNYEARMTGCDLFKELQEQCWTFEIYYDVELEIGDPHQCQSRFRSPVEVSPFVLSVGFIGPNEEDETASIKPVADYIRHAFSTVQGPGAKSGIIVTHDDCSVHIRMACIPQNCEVCGRCKDCSDQLPAVEILVESLWRMIDAMRQRQITSNDPITPDHQIIPACPFQPDFKLTMPYPKTHPIALRQLLVQVCDFQRPGIHQRDVLAVDHSLLHIARNGRKLIASTYESAPYINFVYNIMQKTLEPQSPETCKICYEPCDSIALLRLMCGCIYCLDCLSRCLESALKSRDGFPPKCCDHDISVPQLAKYLEPWIVHKYVAVADEYREDKSFYCANKSCAAFIRGSFVDSDAAMCPRCMEQTCVDCRKLESKHFYGIARQCPKDAEESMVLEMASEENWSVCPRCAFLLERIDGCNHMKCRCGQMFCYECDVAYDYEPSCDCGLGVESDDERNHDEEENDEMEDDEDDEDAAQREVILEAGIALLPGDVARIRAGEVRLREEMEANAAERTAEM